MKNLKPWALMATLIVLPGVAAADEFDITMDVVGAEESFDEVIVNRIALPFGQNESRRVETRETDALSSNVLGEVGEVVDDQLSGADVGDDLALEQVMGMDEVLELEVDVAPELDDTLRDLGGLQ